MSVYPLRFHFHSQVWLSAPETQSAANAITLRKFEVLNMVGGIKDVILSAPNASAMHEKI